jgi:putative tricarboxylic transport membrane protein
MKSQKDNRRTSGLSRRSMLALCAVAAGFAGPAFAAEWQPEGTVEIVIPGTPGSAPDTRARKLQAIWRATGIVKNPVVVVNKPGGGHSTAANYLMGRPPGSAIGITQGTLLTSQILKNHDFDYRQLTPIAFIGNEYYFWVVKSGSDIKSGKDLFERLKKDPASITIGASNPGGNGHIQILSTLKEAGVDISKIKVVTFAGGGETRTALLGGHIGTTATTGSNIIELQRSGELRTIAASAPSRAEGPFKDVPTLGELGVQIPSFLSGWTAILGPPKMTPEQIAYWEKVIADTMKTQEWKDDAATVLRDLDYKNGAETARFLAAEYAATEKMVADTLGAAK